MENINKQSLVTINNGSYGIILFDNNNAYKLSFLVDNDLILKNNIIECCMLKNKLYNGISKNIITAIVEIYTIKNLLEKFKFDDKFFKILKDYKCKNEDYVFLSKMKKYDTSLYEYYKKYKFNNFNYIAKELLLGLNVLHQNNFLHGDLKLANVIYNYTDLNLVLIDFGGIKTIDSLFYNKTCTLTYRSPEELNYEINIKDKFFKPSFQNDIWSLGIIFSEILFSKSFIQNLYNTMINTIKVDKNIDKEILLEEKFFYWFMNRRKVFNIGQYAEEYNIKNVDNKIINIINKMLSIDNKTRYNTLNEIYYDLFNENINTNFKINYIYELFISSNNFIKLKEIRENYYKWLLDFYTNDEILVVLPLTFNIADRFYSHILTNNIDINSKTIDFDINKIIMICCNLLSMVFLYKELPCITDVYNFFYIKNIKINYFDIIIQTYICNILIYLDYDIYRPFINNKLTITIFNDPELFLKYKNKLYKNIHQNIISGKINIAPEDYILY
jgi:serine/threonine protein kinase